MIPLRLQSLAFLLVLTGCAGLYNQPRHDLAVAAQKAVQDAKLEQVLDDERAQNAAIAESELAAARQQAVAARDAELILVIGQADAGSALSDLKKLVADRKKTLDGGHDEVAVTLSDIGEQERAVDKRAARYRMVHRRADPALECGKVRPSSDFSSPELFLLWSGYQTECDDLKKSRNALAALRDEHRKASAIAAVETRIATALQLSEEAEARASALSDEYRKQAKDIAARRAKGERDLGKTAQDLKADLAKIKLPSESSLDDLGAAGAKARLAVDWLDTQLASLARLVDAAAAAPTSVPTGVDDDVQIAAMLPSIHNEIVAGFAYPRVTSLVHELHRVGIERDSWERQALRHDRQIVTLKRQRDALLKELAQLGDARASITEAEKGCAQALKPKSLADFETFADVPGQCGDRLRFALNAYANAWTLGRIPNELARWELTHVDHERALDSSESALRSWNSLLSVQLDALVASYASGVKPDDIGRAVHALELGAIAAGVP